ncbi:hypothetical protein Tsubulata_007769 [Turnera subulata]|uniref:Epidermal patterning factor-like protein n=1 Tax=Turnera subulata TaxID=218843 RepID=A0A9Q0JE00_9ROSI|nr:hypothetical protein Tsubulata_007769 [Turnera subulata]
MASSTRCYLLMLIVLSFAFSPSPSEGSSWLSIGSEGTKHKEMGVGSRPPRCVNKCFVCRPCMPVLVTLPHHGHGFPASSKAEPKDNGPSDSTEPNTSKNFDAPRFGYRPTPPGPATTSCREPDSFGDVGLL